MFMIAPSTKDILEEVKIEFGIPKRHYLIEIDEDDAKVFHKNAQREGIPDSALVSKFLREQLVETK